MSRPKLLGPSQERRLDRYELIGELASGGMATVFLARLAGAGGFQRFVAIKRLHPHLSSQPEFVRMFLDEARLAASIRHANVVPILEVGATEASGYYVVMEYVEGDVLVGIMVREAERQRRLPASIALRWAIDALVGLHAAHELRNEDGKLVHLVHRDVSPQNILVGVDGIAKITDFGVAHAAERLSTTQSGTLKGKLAYMAPEQAGGSAVDRRADVFAMGVVLWEMLTGRRLLKGETELATLNRILKEPIPHARDSEPGIPEGVDAVLMKALERDRDRRYATAAEMAEALEKAATGSYPIASLREAAKYVDEILGDEIRSVRAEVKAYLADPANAPSRVSMPPMSGAPGDGTRASIPATTKSSSVADDADTKVRRGSRRGGLLAGALAVLLVLVAAFVWGFTRGENVSVNGSHASAPPSGSAPATTSAAASTTPPSSPPMSTKSSDALAIDALPPAGAPAPTYVYGTSKKPKKDDPQPKASAAPPPPEPPPEKTAEPPKKPPPPPDDDGYQNPYR